MSKLIRMSALLSLLCALLGCGAGGGGDDDGAPPPSYAIAGRVTLGGGGFEGATVVLDGAAHRVAVTDASGGFAFDGLAEGDYTLTPAIEGQQVSPSARAVRVAGASVAAADFALVTHALSGSVVRAGQGCPGATVTLRQEGQPDRAVTTSWGGDYAFAGLLNGTYTLEAAVEGQTLRAGFPNPLAVAGEGRSGLDWLVETHDVTGRVERAGGEWAGGGLVVLGGDATSVAELDAAGRFAFRGLANGSYTLTPFVPGQAVTPDALPVEVAGSDRVASPFALVTHALSGRIALDEAGQAGAEAVAVALTGPVSATATTGPDGRFAFDGLVNGLYAVTPALPGATLVPLSRDVAVLDADAGGTDFLLSYDAPAVATRSADHVAAAGAILRGAVRSVGVPATTWFEWGTDPALWFPQQTPQEFLPANAATMPVSRALPDLSPGTTYYVRAVAVSRGGTTRGEIESFTTDGDGRAEVVVNSLDDVGQPPEGVMTLRAALDRVAPGGRILFDPALDGGTIALGLVAEDHTVLKGELYVGMQFQGFGERDYGRSALYAAKDVAIDASALPRGITLRWAGSEENPARVLAVYGNLTLANVTVTGGRSRSEPVDGGYTLARGAGLAVWGVAALDHCTVSGNEARGDESPSRDRGAFGGGIYADTVLLRNCVVAGNAVLGYGAAGGGVYSVGGAESYQGSILEGCAVSGNRVTGQHAYGGGVYSDGGGPGSWMTLELTNCTVARNQVEDHPDLPQVGQYYYRGGGVYLSNGYLTVTGCTIAENAVTGPPAVFGGKPNTGGGGVAATIGNAHVVEDMELRHSLVAGNSVNGTASDIYTGSLLHFYSWGYNLVGRIDFSQMLVPVRDWMCLNRRHWPKVGDREGVDPAEVLSPADASRHPTVLSAGTDAGQKAVLWMPPRGEALDRIPRGEYEVSAITAGYDIVGSADDFLPFLLAKLDADYAPVLGGGFGAAFRESFEAAHGPLDAVAWTSAPTTWPSDPLNAPWIAFWHELDAALGDRLGAVRLGDDFWGTFVSGPLGDNLSFYVEPWTYGPYRLSDADQRGVVRPAGARGDVGAVEVEGNP